MMHSPAAAVMESLIFISWIETDGRLTSTMNTLSFTTGEVVVFEADLVTILMGIGKDGLKSSAWCDHRIDICRMSIDGKIREDKGSFL